MNAFLTLITPPGDGEESDWDDEVVRALSLEETMLHLRAVTGDIQQNLISDVVDAATQGIDGGNGWLGRALLTQTWKLTLDGFPCDRITIPLPPLQSITSIKYLDSDGVQQTWNSANYRVVNADPAYVEPVTGQSWPTTACKDASVEVQFVCGYGDKPKDIPALIRQYIKKRVGDFYQNAETLVIGTSAAELPYIGTILDNFRVLGALHAGGKKRSDYQGL